MLKRLLLVSVLLVLVSTTVVFANQKLETATFELETPGYSLELHNYIGFNPDSETFYMALSNFDGKSSFKKAMSVNVPDEFRLRTESDAIEGEIIFLGTGEQAGIINISQEQGQSGKINLDINFNDVPLDVIYKNTLFVDIIIAQSGEIIDNSYFYVRFTNMPSNWAIPEFVKYIDYGLGVDAALGNFSSNITRAEFAEVIVALYEGLTGEEVPYPDKNVFTDVSYHVDIMKAYNLGIVQGMSATTFAPNATITREQIAVMFYRTLQKAGVNVRAGMAVNYTDKNAVSSWATDAVGFMSSEGIIGGVGNNMLNPKGTATKEQAIALVVRTFEKFKK